MADARAAPLDTVVLRIWRGRDVRSVARAPGRVRHPDGRGVLPPPRQGAPARRAAHRPLGTRGALARAGRRRAGTPLRPTRVATAMSGLNAIARRVAAGAGSNAAGRLAILL